MSADDRDRVADLHELRVLLMAAGWDSVGRPQDRLRSVLAGKREAEAQITRLIEQREEARDNMDASDVALAECRAQLASANARAEELEKTLWSARYAMSRVNHLLEQISGDDHPEAIDAWDIIADQFDGVSQEDFEAAQKRYGEPPSALHEARETPKEAVMSCGHTVSWHALKGRGPEPGACGYVDSAALRKCPSCGAGNCNGGAH